MEVDEIDTGLLEQFGSLQTVDHADLVRQMRKLVGGEESITETCAQFYLEMSNWNGKINSGYGYLIFKTSKTRRIIHFISIMLQTHEHYFH